MLMNARKTATKLVSKVIKKHGKLRFFYTCRAYHSILDDSNTMGSNLWKFLTIARWWNLPVNCLVIHCMCNIEFTRQKTSNLRLCRLRFFKLSAAHMLILFPFYEKVATSDRSGSQACSKVGGRGGSRPPQILADQLTLSQPGGTHYPHPVLPAPPDF